MEPPLKHLIKIGAILFLMYGAATGLGRILWGEAWLGFIVTGGALLLGVFISSKLASAKKENNFLKVKEILDVLDIGQLTRDYPFYSTGIAAAAGFALAAGKTPTDSPIFSMLFKVAEDVLKESLKKPSASE